MRDPAPSRRDPVTLAQRAFIALGLAIVLTALALDVRASPEPLHWDLMFATGMATLLAGLAATEGYERRVDATLRRLVGRGVISHPHPDGTPHHLPDADLQNLLQRVHDRARRWGRNAAIAGGLLTLAAFLAAPGQHHAVLHALGLTGGAFVGYHLGRFTSYGRLGSHIEKLGLLIVVKPHHPDGVAGLRPIGEIYFRQAMLAAIPAAFLATWSFLIPSWPTPDYAEWKWPYLALLALSLAGITAAFLAPMWTFHRIMQERKDKLIEDADKSSRRIVEIKTALPHATDDDERDRLTEELARLTEDYAAIEHMPTWPIDPTTKKRFLNRNLALALLPILGNIIGLSPAWREFFEVLVGG